MAAALKGAAASTTSKTNAPVVGGAAGSAIAALATQISDSGWRNLVTVSAPIIAVVLAAVWDAVCQMAKRKWDHFNQRSATRTATDFYQEVMRNPNTPKEVKDVAERAMINAQIATIKFHDSNLNIASQVSLPDDKRNQSPVSTRKKHAQANSVEVQQKQEQSNLSDDKKNQSRASTRKRQAKANSPEAQQHQDQSTRN